MSRIKSISNSSNQEFTAKTKLEKRDITHHFVITVILSLFLLLVSSLCCYVQLPSIVYFLSFYLWIVLVSLLFCSPHSDNKLLVYLWGLKNIVLSLFEFFTETMNSFPFMASFKPMQWSWRGKKENIYIIYLVFKKHDFSNKSSVILLAPCFAVMSKGLKRGACETERVSVDEMKCDTGH